MSIPVPRTRNAMIKDSPDHHDADLVLRLYDLRREPVLRESRRWLSAEFWPKSAEEVLALTKADHPSNAMFRQVVGYWEMAYGLARHGIVNPDYLAENAGEGIFLFAKVQPWLTELRAASSPKSLRNTEWISTQCEEGRELFAYFRQRVEKALAARRGA
ncbi:MAG TPA: hypothetical protein VGP87_16000 [Gemmatimonadales bacterium]|jgi:hypothetical protein|nr:hypothetical protein [Gemmatimonadales bacterium]